MSNEKSFNRGRPQSAPQSDWDDKPNSGDTHYFYKANGFTITGGEFTAVRGNVNHYYNDLKDSTNYSGQSASDNTREFGTDAIFNAGDFTHANGDSHYYGKSNSYSGQSTHYNYQESTNYGHGRRGQYGKGGANNSQNLRNPPSSNQGFEGESFPYDNRQRSGRGARPSPRQDYHAQGYSRADEGRWNYGQAREDRYQNPPSYRERSFHPQQLPRNTRENYDQRQNDSFAWDPSSQTNDSEQEAPPKEEQQITEALVKCLSFDYNLSQDQKNSKEQVIAALVHYFEFPEMDTYDELVRALSQYQTVHKDHQLRRQLFKALRQYLHRGQERDWDGFFDAVTDWEALYNEQGRSDGSDREE